MAQDSRDNPAQKQSRISERPLIMGTQSLYSRGREGQGGPGEVVGAGWLVVETLPGSGRHCEQQGAEPLSQTVESPLPLRGPLPVTS